MASTLSMLEGSHLLSLMVLGIMGRMTRAGRPTMTAATMAATCLASLLRRGICIR